MVAQLNNCSSTLKHLHNNKNTTIFTSVSSRINFKCLFCWQRHLSMYIRYYMLCERFVEKKKTEIGKTSNNSICVEYYENMSSKT